MKKFPSLLLASGALLFAAALPAAPFEGKVTMNITPAKGESHAMTFSLKDGVSRIDIEGKKGKAGAMIMNMAKQEMIMLMDEQKMYMVYPLPKPEAQPGQPQQPQAPRSDVSLDKTGETEKILGYTCEKYVAKSKDGSSEIWVTDQLGTFMGMGAGGNPMAGRRGGNTEPQPWEKALMGKNFFPLRTVVFDKAGKEAMRMEATSVEKQSLPASLFAPPADYKKFEMPNIGDMMKGMMPGAR